MPKFKSPGQKRKGMVRIIAFLVLIAATYTLSLFLGAVTTEELAWTADHQEVMATITELSHESEEYRNLKGRLRTKDVYYAAYEFSVDSEQYANSIEISHSEFASHEDGDQIPVWYATDDPDLNDTKMNIQSAINNNDTVGNMVQALPFSIPATMFIYWLLTLIFVRESKTVLPEGFYTESSWLDVDDHYLVSLDNNDLVYFKFDAKRSAHVQESYQNGVPLEELIATSKASKFKRLPLSEIAGMRSDHNSDVIHIEHGDDTHMVEFLNQTVKAHALERIKKLIPASLEYAKIEKTRIQAALPSLITLLLLCGGIAYFDLFIVQIILGFAALVWVLPKLISRLINPTITEKWMQPTTELDSEPAA